MKFTNSGKKEEEKVRSISWKRTHLIKKKPLSLIYSVYFFYFAQTKKKEKKKELNVSVGVPGILSCHERSLLFDKLQLIKWNIWRKYRKRTDEHMCTTNQNIDRKKKYCFMCREISSEKRITQQTKIIFMKHELFVWNRKILMEW